MHTQELEITSSNGAHVTLVDARLRRSWLLRPFEKFNHQEPEAGKGDGQEEGSVMWNGELFRPFDYLI
jgi:hypothetical protein